MTRAQERYDAQVRAASTVNGQRSESRRRPLPRSAATMTDDEPGPGLAELTVTADDVLGPMLAPSEGVRGWVDLPRQANAYRAAPGVHPDIDLDPADPDSIRANKPPEPGEQLMDVSGDERLVPGGAAEREWAARTARHRAGTWPPDDDVLIDVRDVREGRYGPR